MKEPEKPNEREDHGRDDPRPNSRESQRDGEASNPEEVKQEHARTPEDEVDEFFKSFGRDVRDKFKNAGLVESVTAISTVILAVVTTWAVSIYGGQLKAMRKQLDSTMIDQRAWVGPTQFVIVNPPVEANKPVEIGMDYVNSGKTPALNVFGFAEPSFVARGTKFDFSKWSDPLMPDRAVLFPGSGNHIVRTVMKDLPNWPANAAIEAIPQELFPDLIAEHSFIYLYGSLDYSDIFGFQHWTHFCVRYSFPYKGFVHCDTFNSVDPEIR